MGDKVFTGKTVFMDEGTRGHPHLHHSGDQDDDEDGNGDDNEDDVDDEDCDEDFLLPRRPSGVLRAPVSEDPAPLGGDALRLQAGPGAYRDPDPVQQGQTRPRPGSGVGGESARPGMDGVDL